MKKGLSLVLSLIMVLGILTSIPLTVNAASVDDLTFELNEDGESYSVTDCDTSAEGELVIPNKYNGLFVTGIGDEAFFWCTNLTLITIPDSVESIGIYSFSGCTNLESIEIPDSVMSIGQDAFSNCTNLTSITISNSVTSIGLNVFYNCTNLKSITIPDGVTSIGSGAFYNCENLTSFTIPDNVTNISDSFINTGYYNNENNWEDGVLYIGNHLIAAYKYDTRLHEYVGNVEGNYTIKQGTITIADCAFYNCTNLTSVTIPNSVIYIGASVFRNCTNLISIEIPNGINTIESYAFRGCTNLTSVTIPDSVTTIGWCAFDCCTNLKSVTIPDSVINIDYGAFGYCPAEFEPNKIDDFVIYGTVGSEAHNYAKENNFRFIDPNHAHTSSSWIIDTKATVYKAGSKHKECTECGEVLETVEIAQLKCSKPTLKSIENTEYGVLTKWGKVKGADKYYIYRKVKGGSYSRIGSTTNTYYTDKTAKSGKKYYYIVKAINEAGASSSSSALSKLYLADPTLKTPTSTKSGVSLKWTKTAGAEGYIIYRKTGSGSYEKLKTEKGVSNLSYVDKSAKKGKKYTYKVKAYKSKTYSAYSNTKSITDKY